MKYLTILSCLLAVASAYGTGASSSSKDKKKHKKDDDKNKEPVNPVPPFPLAPNLARDLETLTAFAKTVTHDPLNFTSTWKGKNPCLFRGIVCDYRPDGLLAVAAIDINGANLKGKPLSLFNFLEKLPDLAFIHANSNEFKGGVPDLSQLPYIYEFDLSNNNLSGPFPDALLHAYKLNFLDIRFNDFEGPIPPAVYSLPLDALFLNNNKFTGPIAPEIGNSPAAYVTFANNKLSGCIPATMGNMVNLTEALFMNNDFDGEIPEELCAKKGIEILDFEDTKVSKELGRKCEKLKKKKKLII